MKNGLKVLEEWIRYESGIKHNSLLPERSVENIYLWGEHLIFGVALDACELAIDDMYKMKDGIKIL